MFNNKLTSIRGGLIVGAIAALFFALSGVLFAQGSPLVIDPSSSRVGISIPNPSEKLDVNGTVKATAFKGDGSQLTNLPVSGGSTAIDKVTANTTVVNTGAETNLYSFSTPGGTLGSSNALRLTIQITDLDVTDGDDCVLRFKYGGITLASVTVSNTTINPVSNAKALITFVIGADGASNAQVGSAFFQASSTFGPYVKQGTSAVDSNAAQTLTVTADWSLASTGNSITLGQAILEKL
jgi:hypothetical protein